MLNQSEHTSSFFSCRVKDKEGKETHRILNRISRKLRNFMINNPLRHTIRSSRISEQLRMARVIQTGEEERGFVHGAADG